MEKILLSMSLLVSSVSFANSPGISCKNRYPYGVGNEEAQTVSLKLSHQSNQTYTAELDIVSWDNKPVAHETLTNLSCDFSSTTFPVARCHYINLQSFALAIDSITTTSRELVYDIDGNVIGGVDVQTEEISISVDVPKDDEYVTYGYGKIIFTPEDCTSSQQD